MSVGGGPSLAQKQLAAELARLRSLAGLDQRQIAAHVGVSQATVSRIERALKLPTRSNVTAWANACGATADAVERVTALTEAAHTQVETWRELASRSPHLQDAVQANEATAATLRAYSPTVVPGLLQTADYARRVLALTDITGQLDVAAGVQGRLRRQEALHDPARRFEFLITEAALRRPLGTLTGHAAQLDRIVSLSTLDNVSVAVLPDDSSAVALPLHGFVIYDDRGEEDPFVTVEMVHGYATITEPRDIALYQEVFRRLSAAAATGADAAALTQRIALELRRGARG